MVSCEPTLVVQVQYSNLPRLDDWFCGLLHSLPCQYRRISKCWQRSPILVQENNLPEHCSCRASTGETRTHKAAVSVRAKQPLHESGGWRTDMMLSYAEASEVQPVACPVVCLTVTSVRHYSQTQTLPYCSVQLRQHKMALLNM
jgi:hypothetical protein